MDVIRRINVFFFLQTIKRRLLLTVTPQGNNKLYTTLARVYQEVDKLKRKNFCPFQKINKKLIF